MRPGDEWLSALWLAALMLPAAAWGAQGGASTATGTPFNRWWLLAVECQAAALLLVPAFAHFAPASLWEWSGLALGALTGAFAAPWLGRWATPRSAR